MPDHTRLVTEYLRSFYAGDPAVRRLMADDFHFSGPAAHLHGADTYLKAAAHAAAGTRGIEIEAILCSTQEAAAFYLLRLEGAVAEARVAERFRIADGRIAGSTLVMDTAPFMRRGGAPADMAIDPVCGMQVDKAAPAATRVHRGTAYYFCSTGCAEAFERSPAGYLPAAGQAWP